MDNAIALTVQTALTYSSNKNTYIRTLFFHYSITQLNALSLDTHLCN